MLHLIAHAAKQTVNVMMPQCLPAFNLRGQCSGGAIEVLTALPVMSLPWTCEAELQSARLVTTAEVANVESCLCM